MADVLVYLYAVGGAELAESVAPGLTGVDGAPVRVVVDGRVGAVVSTVDPLHFGEDALQRNLEDLTWLAETARAHHAVVDAVSQRHPVAPLRMATVYLDDDNVRALLRRKNTAFTAVLDRIRGRREWGVKAFARWQPDVEPDRGAGDADLGPGAAYLLRKRIARERSARAQQKVEDAAAKPPVSATGPAALRASGAHGAERRLPRRGNRCGRVPRHGADVVLTAYRP
jgi:hypothetical protein